MEILHKSIFIIDYDSETLNQRNIPDDFNSFIDSLITHINTNTSVRKYKPKAQTTQVVTCSREIVNNIIDPAKADKIDEISQGYFQEIANRLLHVEIETQAQINRLGQKIKKGSLVQALLYSEEDSEYFLLIAKVEHTGFIDDFDFSFKSGFSSEQQKIWKSCVLDIIIDDDGSSVDSAKIYLDKAAKYWSDSFLELEEMVDDENNTKRAFKYIENTLIRNVKRDAPSDYLILRNSIIGQLKSARHIDYNDMIENIFEDYTPTEMPPVQLATIKTKLLELPDNKNFDRQFVSVPSAINARIRKIYQINDAIELKIKDHVGDIRETIQSIEEADGKRYIKIRTDNEETFNTFKR
jgi:hypothetical protein